MHCDKVFHKFNWSMKGEWFSTNVIVIPLENYHMVFGIQWLVTLGEINWNFSILTMSIKMSGKEFQLNGEMTSWLNLHRPRK